MKLTLKMVTSQCQFYQWIKAMKRLQKNDKNQSPRHFMTHIMVYSIYISYFCDQICLNNFSEPLTIEKPTIMTFDQA